MCIKWIKHLFNQFNFSLGILTKRELNEENVQWNARKKTRNAVSRYIVIHFSDKNLIFCIASCCFSCLVTAQTRYCWWLWEARSIFSFFLHLCVCSKLSVMRDLNAKYTVCSCIVEVDVYYRTLITRRHQIRRLLIILLKRQHSPRRFPCNRIWKICHRQFPFIFIKTNVISVWCHFDPPLSLQRAQKRLTLKALIVAKAEVQCFWGERDFFIRFIIQTQKENHS